ncbi:lytic polysaccharide monooxygenase [Xylariaceae sp. FL0804]|nr:lytic polysaccharide monooxygenase [Xylariaceae sp. FL0804]
MRHSLYAIVGAALATNVVGHATFQDLWHGGQCVRLPPSNNPVTDVTSDDIRCNVGGTTGVSGKCAVKAGENVTIEMHQQPGDRSCSEDAIGGDHYGPVHVYLTQVDDAATADGSTSWYKIFADTWASTGGAVGDDDNWGTKDLNTCCGKMDIPIPADTPDGDYLLRAEVIALHVASSSGGAQFYMSCYQITVSGGSATATLPSGVLLPGAYAASDPGILINIHAAMSTYADPGPTVIAAGTQKSAGSGCGAGCADTCTAGTGATGTALSASVATATATGSAATGTATGSASGGSGSCAQAQYQQCGGQGYTGCTTCASGFTCKDVSAPYYSQCQ